MAETKRGGFGKTIGLALLLVVVALAAGIGIARYGDRVGVLAPLIGEPQRSSESVVQGIQQLNELATAEMVVETIVTEEADGTLFRVPVPDWVRGENVLLIATGKVQAGVDLDELTSNDVHIEGERVTISLPEAEILGASLNEDETGVYSRQRGIFRPRGDDALLDEARRDAVDEITAVARENNILDEAQGNAEESIRALATSLGYDEVTFTRN